MSNDVKFLVKNITILIIVLFISNYFSITATNLYDEFLNSGSSFVNLDALVGFPLSYVFFLTLIFTAFGGDKKYWWIGILLIPAAIFEIYFDLEHIYFPITIGLVGWFLGFLTGQTLRYLRFYKSREQTIDY